MTRSPLNTTHIPTSVTWSLSSNTETLAASHTTVFSVNGETFYLTRIPFETRKLADGTVLPTTPNTLALTATATAYTRSATVDGLSAILPAGTGTFSYGAATQGLIERLDLVLGETFAEWSQRIFGALIGQAGDADGDGISNYQEYLAGTDPKSAASRLFVKEFKPTPGGITFSWDSINGKTYAVERSADLKIWTVVQPNLPGTGAPLTYTDSDTAGKPKLFYRVTTPGAP